MKFLDRIFLRVNVIRTDNPLSIVGDGWKHFRAEVPWYCYLWTRLREL